MSRTTRPQWIASVRWHDHSEVEEATDPSEVPDFVECFTTGLLLSPLPDEDDGKQSIKIARDYFHDGERWRWAKIVTICRGCVLEFEPIALPDDDDEEDDEDDDDEEDDEDDDDDDGDDDGDEPPPVMPSGGRFVKDLTPSAN